MNQSSTPVDQEWLKVLGKGMITLPKKWRDEMGINQGDVVKAKKEGNRVLIEPKLGKPAPYRVYTKDEIETFLREDKVPKTLIAKAQKDLSSRSS